MEDAGSDTQRNARTQRFFRDVNERITTINHGMSDRAEAAERLLEVLCECGRPHCTERIELTHAEYELVRSQPTHFLLVAGHEEAIVEHVVARTARYVIAANDGEAARHARSTDPRRRS